MQLRKISRLTALSHHCAKQPDRYASGSAIVVEKSDTRKCYAIGQCAAELALVHPLPQQIIKMLTVGAFGNDMACAAPPVLVTADSSISSEIAGTRRASSLCSELLPFIIDGALKRQAQPDPGRCEGTAADSQHGESRGLDKSTHHEPSITRTRDRSPSLPWATAKKFTIERKAS